MSEDSTRQSPRDKVATVEFNNMTSERLLALKLALEDAGFDLEMAWDNGSLEMFDDVR